MTVRRQRASFRKPGRRPQAQTQIQTVTAIPTTYRGVKMRSRLEARWAGVFDAAGLVWQYEPEGIPVGRLGFYRPDFWLPAQRTWIEVKGPHMERVNKTRALARQLGARGLVLMATAVGSAYLVPASGRIPQAEVEIGRCDCGMTAVGVPGRDKGSGGRIRCRSCDGLAVPSHVLGW
jgi:hypothetical protein